MLQSVFGTATLPRGVSEPALRGETVIHRPLRRGDLAHRHFRGIPACRTIPQPISKRFLFGVITGLRHVDLAQRCLRGISVWRDGLKPVIYLFLSMKLAFFMDIEVLTGCLSMKLAFFMDIEV